MMDKRYVLVKGPRLAQLDFLLATASNWASKGANGAIIAGTYERFHDSVWPAFRVQCHWDKISLEHQYRQNSSWVAYSPFRLDFSCNASLWFGWSPLHAMRGLQLSFAVICDESVDGNALGVMDCRVRISKPDGSLPQLLIAASNGGVADSYVSTISEFVGGPPSVREMHVGNSNND